MPLNTSAIPLIHDFERVEGYPKDSLLNVMLFETAGTLSTSIKNQYSGAVGLIQFMPATCNALGYTVAQVAAMTVPQQLALVRRYLQPYRPRLLKTTDALDFYLAVLYPALMGKPDSAYMANDRTKQLYIQNAGLDMDKDGDIQRGDIRVYFSKIVTGIRKKNNLPAAIIGGSLATVLLIAATVFF